MLIFCVCILQFLFMRSPFLLPFVISIHYLLIIFILFLIYICSFLNQIYSNDLVIMIYSYFQMPILGSNYVLITFNSGIIDLLML